jgi:excisionase family DNA binding protein
MIQSKLLTPKEVSNITSWSLQKIRQLIHAKKLPAINTSTGKRPTFLIREIDLQLMLTPTEVDCDKARDNRGKSAKKNKVAIDSHVPNVFGNRKVK